MRRQSVRHACLKSADQKQAGEGEEGLAGKGRGRAQVPRHPHLVEHLCPGSLDPPSARHGDRGFRRQHASGKRGKRGGGGARNRSPCGVCSPCKQDGSIPREIDAFLKSLRNHPLWLRDFRRSNITDIKRMPSARRKHRRRSALRSSVCRKTPWRPAAPARRGRRQGQEGAK